MPFWVAICNPSGHSYLFGAPKTVTILVSWSLSDVPGKMGRPRNISPMIHPKAKMSIFSE